MTIESIVAEISETELLNTLDNIQTMQNEEHCTDNGLVMMAYD